jgi:hypothetical protein
MTEKGTQKEIDMTEETRLVVQDDPASILIFKEFDKIPSASLAKDLTDLALEVPDVLSEEEVRKHNRLKDRLAGAGNAVVGSFQQRAVLAEMIYAIHQEEDYKLLVQNGKAYTWVGFRKRLAPILGVGTGTIGEYIKIVRFGREVLGLSAGQLPDANGIITVNHVRGMCSGIDGRSSKDYAETVRPKSKTLEKKLEGYDGESWPEKLQSYYNQDVVHNFEDPTAINRPPQELAEQASQMLGRPNVWAEHLMDGDRVSGFAIHVQYADYEEDGMTVVGEHEKNELLFHGEPLPVIRDWLEDRMRVKT